MICMTLVGPTSEFKAPTDCSKCTEVVLGVNCFPFSLQDLYVSSVVSDLVEVDFDSKLMK